MQYIKLKYQTDEVDLFSDETVTEQHTHGIDLHRNTPGIPQGIDAAVAEGRLDLKVKNNTAYTFQIQISVDKYHMRGKVLSDAKLRTAAG